MNSTSHTPLVIAFVAVVVLFLIFGGEAITGGMMSSGMNAGGWMEERGWIWIPAFLALGLGVALGWALLKKKA